jgi:hypothetical protein
VLRLGWGCGRGLARLWAAVLSVSSRRSGCWMLSQEAELSDGRASRADEDKPHPAPNMYTSNERRVSYAHIAALLSLKVTILPPCDCPLCAAGRAPASLSKAHLASAAPHRQAASYQLVALLSVHDHDLNTSGSSSWPVSVQCSARGLPVCVTPVQNGYVMYHFQQHAILPKVFMAGLRCISHKTLFGLKTTP